MKIIRAQTPGLYLALRGTQIGDAFGAGWEMTSAAYVVQNWALLVSKYRNRSGNYAVNHQLGGYTDDFEMTIGVCRELTKAGGLLTKDGLVLSFLEVDRVNLADRGPRCGHGSFKRVLAKVREGIDYSEELEAIRASQAKQDPGNGALMRLMPVYFLSKSDDDRFYNAMINSFATHPHPVSVFASFCLIRACEILLTERKTDNLIARCLETGQEKFRELLPEMLEDPHFMKNQDVSAHVSRMVTRLQQIDQIPLLSDNDLQLGDLTDEQRLLISGDYAPQLKGESGMPGKAEQSLYCSLFLLKNLATTDAWGTLQRCIAVGGDTDTLAAIVLSILLPYYGDRPEGLTSIPEWILAGIENPPAELLIFED